MHKLIQEVRIRNPLGLHARPSSTIAQLLQGVKSSVTIHYKNLSANAKSVMELLMLAAKQGARVKITVEGEDASDVMERLVAAFERGFEGG
ncbi:MAG: HPr family phosphocarrier protein [Parachlamydiales bacterium]